MKKNHAPQLLTSVRPSAHESSPLPKTFGVRRSLLTSRGLFMVLAGICPALASVGMTQAQHTNIVITNSEIRSCQCHSIARKFTSWASTSK